MKNTAFKGLFACICVFLTVGSLACENREEEELKKQIQMQINMLEREVNSVEQHQQAMRALIQDMQTQLSAIQEELNKEAPRIHAANMHLMALRDLTTLGMGEGPAESTIREPAWNMWNVLWLVLFVFILWLFYRFRQRRIKDSRES